MLAPISGIRGVAYGAEEGVHRLQFSEATGKMAIPVMSSRLISRADVDHIPRRGMNESIQYRGASLLLPFPLARYFSRKKRDASSARVSENKNSLVHVVD